MTRKVYRSAQGRMVDIGALQLQNESVRAVGNMPVNARGDIVDGWNRPIDSRNQQVAKQYHRQTNVVDEPVMTSAPVAQIEKPKEKTKKVKVSAPITPEDFDDDFVRPAVNTVGAGGLAAAIAKAREIKQDPILPSRQQAKTAPGVTKI